MTYKQYGSSLLKYLKWFIIYRNMAMREKKLGENLYVYITLISTIVKNIVVLAISKESNTVPDNYATTKVAMLHPSNVYVSKNSNMTYNIQLLKSL